jgi:predicted Zn-dependent protease
LKPFIKIAALFIVAAVVLLVLFLMRESTKPESDIIAAERADLARLKDNKRAEQDPVYAASLESKLRFLDYRQAVAYNSENRPDNAIAVLRRIISEESQKKDGMPRRSRSYTAEAQYYEALATSYELKKDPDEAKKAMQSREELLARAAETRKIEDLAEGKSINMKD